MAFSVRVVSPLKSIDCAVVMASVLLELRTRYGVAVLEYVKSDTVHVSLICNVCIIRTRNTLN